MKKSRPWVYYSILRVAIFVVIFAILLLLNVNPWIATAAAAILGLCLSYIFLKGPRDAVARDIYIRRNGLREDRDADNDLENEILDQRGDDRGTFE